MASEMTSALTKEVVISYAAADRETAAQVSAILHDWFGTNAWLRDFDLDAGQLIADAIGDAIGEARWFILLLSPAAAESNWVRLEANLATFRAIESEAFNIVAIRLDSSSLPKSLAAPLKAATVFHVTPSSPIEEVMLSVLELMDQAPLQHARAEVYVDRGSDADRFALIARQNSIVFVIGLAGIGKTAFCRHSISERLRKRPIIVRLTRGHSADLLARQIIERCHVGLPTMAPTDDQTLIAVAIDALAKRATKFFLFLDNAEDAGDANNALLPYLSDFCLQFIKRGISTHLIIASTRQLDYSPAIASNADVFRLAELEDIYVHESLDLWLDDPAVGQNVPQEEMSQLVRLARGFPLAAKMIASSLKAGFSPSGLLTATQRKRFELRLAAHLLRTADKELSELERLILHILATVASPMTLADMRSIPELERYDVDRVHNAVYKLSSLFLVEHSGELVFLQKFIARYFEEQINVLTERRNSIAKQFGKYAYSRAISLNDELSKELTVAPGGYEDEGIARLSAGVLRYAIPAARLLRSVNEIELASRLPIQTTGTLREMVFYFYQDVRQYQTALQYAEEWLSLNPGDLEVQLYKARCLRNLRGAANLRTAEAIVRALEVRASSRHFRSRLCRERALIADAQGDFGLACEHYERGIEASDRYIDNYVGLAQVLLRESEKWPESYREAEAATRSVSLLEAARATSATFDRWHLSLYVEALVRANRAAEGIPLIQEALTENPNDPRLNYRLGEMARRDGSLADAEEYATRALKAGSAKARLTLANVFCARAIEAQEQEAEARANQLLERARTTLDSFVPEFGHDLEVAADIRAKTYRLQGAWDEAARTLEPYPDSENPYTVYEQAHVSLHLARRDQMRGDLQEARARLTALRARLQGLDQQGKLSSTLRETLSDAELQLGSLDPLQG